MSEDWNLSMERLYAFHQGQAGNFYPEDGVKEFIRRLKEGIHDFNETEFGDKARNDFIDKLAGSKLVDKDES